MKVRYFTRGGKVWLDIRPPHGERRRVSSGKATEQEAREATPALLALLFPDQSTTGTLPQSDDAQRVPFKSCGFTFKEAYGKAWTEHEKWIGCKDPVGKKTTYNAVLASDGVRETMDMARFDYDFVMALRAKWLNSEGLRKGSKLSNSTINHRLSFISTLLEVCRCRPHGVKHLSVKGNGRKRRTQDQELEAMINWLVANHKRKGALALADLIQVALRTTARKGEWLDMEWPDVYFDSASVLYRDTKNGESRPGTLDDVSLRILERRRSYGLSGPFKDLSRSQVYSLWNDGKEALGLKDDQEFVFHVATRHEGLSRLGDGGASAFQIKAYGGHSSIVAADRYVRPSVESLRSLASHISNPSGIRSRDESTSVSDAEKH